MIPGSSYLHSHSPPASAVAFFRLAGMQTVGAIAVLLTPWIPGAPLGGLTPEIIAATAVCWLGGIAAAIAPAIAIRREAVVLGSAMLASLGIRFLVTLAAAFLVRSLRPTLAADAYLIGVGVVQAVLLAIDVAAQIHLARRAVSTRLHGESR